MRLMFDMPSRERAVFDSHAGEGEKLLYCIPFNILEDRFVSGYIAITNKKIYKIPHSR